MIGEDQPAIRSAEAEQKGRQERAIGEATARIRHKAQAFKRVFRDHPDGKYVLLCLKQEFMPPQMFHPDGHVTIANAARRDMLDYIERMIRFEEEKPHVAETELLPER